MLRFLVHMMRTKLPQLSRYLEMYLDTRCDLTRSQEPCASTPVGYEQPRTPQATSCYQPLSHGPQDHGYRTESLSAPPSLPLPALEKTKLATPLHLPLHAKVGYEQPQPPQATSCD